jgi:hypothetical protein
VGISGLAKVQYAVSGPGKPWPAEDPDLSRADWKDAEILPPPSDWGGGLPGGKLPASTLGVDPKTGRPREWPLPFTIAHWAALIAPLPAGSYEAACRTIDRNGVAQPMPRPFLRSGVTAIHRVRIFAP